MKQLEGRFSSSQIVMMTLVVRPGRFFGAAIAHSCPKVPPDDKSEKLISIITICDDGNRLLMK
jgi:hypothetical protein